MREAGAGDADHLRRRIPFVEVGNKLTAHAGRRDTADGNQQRRDHRDAEPVADRGSEQRRVDSVGSAHKEILMFGNIASNQQSHGCRHKCHRQNAGAGQRHQHRQGHRREHLSFDAGERQDWQIDDCNNERSKQAGADDLA